MTRLLFMCAIALIGSLTCSDLNAASKSKKPKEKIQFIENKKPSESKRIITRVDETNRVILDKGDGDEWGHSSSWKEVHVTHTIVLDDDSKAKLTVIWGGHTSLETGYDYLNEDKKLTMDEFYNIFYLDSSDEIQFMIPKQGYAWKKDLGNFLRFKLIRNGVSVGVFNAFYLSPGANTHTWW